MPHTPGPWKVEQESGNDGEAEVIVADNRTICWTADTWDDARKKAVITAEDYANGVLIASAPDLLDALRNTKDELIALYERLYPNDESENDTTLVIDQAIAAIEKATRS